MLIEISNEEKKPVKVDARDKLGRTPLHLALAKETNRYDDDKLLKLFFDTSKKVDRPVQVDVQDKNGRTPLQWTVANLFLNAVDVLTDRGADLSFFVFPS
uniref:Uncharacterized protein n=1 Tax=Trichogramma kaykai TaxID=54128 RepID=A0ABD2WKK0_9HYME